MKTPQSILARQLPEVPRPTGPAQGSCPKCQKPVVWIVDNAERFTETCDAEITTMMTAQGRKIRGYKVHVCGQSTPPR